MESHFFFSFTDNLYISRWLLLPVWDWGIESSSSGTGQNPSSSPEPLMEQQHLVQGHASFQRCHWGVGFVCPAEAVRGEWDWLCTCLRAALPVCLTRNLGSAPDRFVASRHFPSCWYCQ